MVENPNALPSPEERPEQHHASEAEEMRQEKPSRMAAILRKFPEVPVTEDERTMAALAHGSILLSLFSAGVGGLLVALVIWGVYRDRSRWVADQALQAFVFQLAALVLTAALALLTTVAWAVTGALIAVLIGLCLVPFAALLTLVAILFPVLALAYGVYGALEAYNGRDFQYLWIGDWLREGSRPSL